MPCIPVFAIEPHARTGKRRCLGVNGPVESFQDNGRGVLSAETGRLHFQRGDRRDFIRRWEIGPGILAGNAPISRGWSIASPAAWLRDVEADGLTVSLNGGRVHVTASAEKAPLVRRALGELRRDPSVCAAIEGIISRRSVAGAREVQRV